VSVCSKLVYRHLLDYLRGNFLSSFVERLLLCIALVSAVLLCLFVFCIYEKRTSRNVYFMHGMYVTLVVQIPFVWSLSYTSWKNKRIINGYKNPRPLKNWKKGIVFKIGQHLSAIYMRVVMGVMIFRLFEIVVYRYCSFFLWYSMERNLFTH